ncbi:NADH-quinone oxidoreductase subunit F, NuoF [Magnetospirillum gryphiswaldense MSR-1 v2]|uniref:NADH-quinone oxidoreductase subunit F, NuoF n=1 Tax=Magnetospirillum gryphiswaldense (strain DSM 6361 / JCM 21280 / NBRC 15271 / MSR-1) TaxID=431944 RepID=V6F0D8_MAGGM|nr:NADH-quinone oxidoreductase subunit NuoF [Magnetospirillum gryphiswaldense]CDK98970.1 NADH-quinone oxidoreductase subunit F, NuoF [Magnetospirillum gryphiswaldense MSR-1 v2]
MSKPVTLYVPCDAAALSVGADAVAAAIAAEAEARRLPVQIIRNGSRGMLWLEPLVEVVTNQGRVAYGPVAPDQVAELFDAGFLDGQPHPLGHGLTEEIFYFKHQQRLTFARCGLIDPLSVADYRAHGGFAGLERALTLSPSEIVEEVTQSGLRGRGGAGFPTGIKWNTVLNASAAEKFVCCNADEGDSGTFADRMIIEGDPFLLIEGMTIAALAVGARQGYVYLRSEYPHAVATLREAIRRAYEQDWLGTNIHGSGHDFHLEVRVGAGSYVCGEETAMLESLEGKRGMVRAKPPIPALQGLFGQPTIVNNVLTLTSVPVVLAKGAAFYRDFGAGRSHGTQPFQLAGNIQRGGLVELAFGVSLHDLIYRYGGGTASGRPLRAVQVGGPLGAYVPESMLGLSADYESMAEAGAMLGHGGIVVFDDSVRMARMARFAMDFCAVESCGKCTPCRIGSTRGREVLDKIVAGENVADNMALLDDLCTVMSDGSLCAMGGLTPLPVQSAIRHFPEDFA